MICMIMHCKMIKLMVNESQLIKEMTTPKSIHEYSYTRYNSRRKNKVKCPGGSHKIGLALAPWKQEMHVKCRMAVSCVSQCLFKGIKPSKNLEPRHDIGEWKEKVCVSIGLLCWSPEKRMMSLRINIHGNGKGLPFHQFQT